MHGLEDTMLLKCIFAQLICKFHAISIKIPPCFLRKFKNVKKCKGPRIAKRIKKKKIVECPLPNFQTTIKLQ